MRNAQRIQYENRLSASTTGSISPDPWPEKRAFFQHGKKKSKKSKTTHAWCTRCHTGDTFFGKTSLRDQRLIWVGFDASFSKICEHTTFGFCTPLGFVLTGAKILWFQFATEKMVR